MSPTAFCLLTGVLRKKVLFLPLPLASFLRRHGFSPKPVVINVQVAEQKKAKVFLWRLKTFLVFWIQTPLLKLIVSGLRNDLTDWWGLYLNLFRPSSLCLMDRALQVRRRRIFSPESPGVFFWRYLMLCMLSNSVKTYLNLCLRENK